LHERAVDRTPSSYAQVLAFGAEVAEVQALRQGSEAAFRSLVERYHSTLMRVAKSLVRDPSVAEEVVQQTWVEVLESTSAFEARSTVRTWLCGICINTARARLRKERRMVPMSAVGAGREPSGDTPESAVDPSRFYPPGSHWEGHWYAFPNPWPINPEHSARSAELKQRLLAAIDALPEPQREVVVLREVEGFSGEEVCNLLGLSATNQRVLLHRARSKLRVLLEDLFDESRST
jgi:RNA polymerase sigma-70 factor (ECF subfamily)